MKIAVTSQGQELDSLLDPRFGRAKYFFIYDSESKKWNSIENTQNLNAAQGAGIQSAQLVVELKADAVITGHTGPKAFKVLKAANVKVYHTTEETVQKALVKHHNNNLQLIESPDVEGHWV